LALILAVGALRAAEPQSVADCTAYALQHSPRLQKLQIAHEDQGLQTVVEKAVYSPHLRLDTSRAETAESETGRATVVLPTVSGFDLSTSLAANHDDLTDGKGAAFSVRLSKQILGGDSAHERRFAIEETVIDQAIALNDITRQRRQVVLEVKRAFYQIIRDLQSLPVQERRLERAKKNLEQAIEREKPLDINTARIEIPASELSVLAAQRAIATGLDSLKVAIGMPVTDELQIMQSFEFRPVQTGVSADLDYATEHDEEFLNNRLEHVKRSQRVAIARTKVWPDVILAVEKQKDSDPPSLNLDGDGELIFSLGLAWDWRRKGERAKLQQALNAVRQNEVDYFVVSQGKAQRLREFDRQLQEIGRSVELQEQRVDLMSRQVELFNDRWENGEIDILELIRSQNDLENSKVEMISLKARYMELVAEYEFAAGR
jgi:outer membrane protein TolC